MKKLINRKKILIIISIILFLFFFGMFTNKTQEKTIIKEKNNENVSDYEDKNELDNVIDNVIIDDKKDEIGDVINEEKSDDKVIKKDDIKPNVSDEKNKDKSSNSNIDKTSDKPNEPVVDNDKNSSDVDNNSTSNKNDSKEEENLEEKPNEPVVVEDKNNVKRKNIESNFGIKILYGDEIGNYKPKGITPIRLLDSEMIENYLDRLNLELNKYPKNFFNDFSKKGMPLTIYLIKSANGAFSGFTDYQFMNDIKLTLATDYNFEYTIHHELMHYIDCYLDIVMYPNDPYIEYEGLNPSGFVYGYYDNTQIYNMANNQRGAYFVSSYAATHVKEDRAEVFKFMMARAYKPIGCFEPNEIIRKKAELISKQIKNYFPSVNGIAHWDRFIV